MENSHEKKVALRLVCLWLTLTGAASAATQPDAPIASDPCVLITAADLRTVLGVTFPHPDISNDIESRQCSYQSDKWLVSIFTGNEELTEFQADSQAAAKTSEQWGRVVKVSGVAVPFYAPVGQGRLIVWKNKTRFTVDLQDVSGTLSAEALEAAREKLVNIGLSRIK